MNISNTSFSSHLIEKTFFIPILSILLLLVMLIGLAGNLLVIYVVGNYSRLKTVTNTYLLHLALSDLVFLSGVPFFISLLLKRSWIFGRLLCKLFFLTQGVNQYTSILILAFLSFDRFLAVCHSAKSIRWRSRMHPHLLLILTWIFSFLLMLPIVIFTTLKETSPSTVQCNIILPFPQSPLLYLIFFAYTSTMTFIVPLIFMVFFYLKIVQRLQIRVPKQHRPSRTSVRTRRKVTVLVLSVISIHVLCCSPYWTFQLIMTTGLLPQISELLIPISTITHFLLFVNSSANPMLYAFISEIFRLSFQRVFHCCSNNVEEKSTTKRNANIATPTTKMIPTTRAVSVDHQRSPMITYAHQRLSVQITNNHLDTLHRQNRLLSLAPTTSIFNSETSFVSDV